MLLFEVNTLVSAAIENECMPSPLNSSQETTSSSSCLPLSLKTYQNCKIQIRKMSLVDA